MRIGETPVRKSICISAFCLGAALAFPALGQQQGRQQGQQMMPQQQFPQSGAQQPSPQQQPQFGPGFQGQQTGLSVDRIRNFFSELAQTLEQSAQNRNPSQLTQYLRSHMAEDAVITVSNELYLGNTLVAQTMAQVPEDTLADALGTASPAIHGRKLVQDYNVDFRIRDIKQIPGTNTARVFAEVTESGRFPIGDAAARLAGIRKRFSEMGMGGAGPQMGMGGGLMNRMPGGDMQGQMGQGQMGQSQMGQ